MHEVEHIQNKLLLREVHHEQDEPAKQADELALGEKIALVTDCIVAKIAMVACASSSIIKRDLGRHLCRNFKTKNF